MPQHVPYFMRENAQDRIHAGCLVPLGACSAGPPSPVCMMILECSIDFAVLNPL
jgi:hypothetical protein